MGWKEGEMLDKKTETVLQILAKNAQSGYTVLKKQPLIDLLPAKFSMDAKGFSSVVSFLKDQGYVDVKYQDKDSICLGLTTKARNHLDGLQDTKGAKLVGNQFGLLLALVGVCAFVGAFLAVVVAQWIF